MNALNLQTHEIVIHQNRKYLVGMTGITVLALLFVVGRDIDEIDTGSYLAVLSLMSTVIWGWALVMLLSRLCQRDLTITINSQGFLFPTPLRFTLLPQFKQSFLPWEEIEWIASSRTGMSTWLSF